MSKKIIGFVILVLICTLSYAQQVPPNGGFLVDSMKIGEPVPYTLSFTYEQQYDAVFPDSLFDFSPFEIDHKTYFPTRTVAGLSYDSAVYYLAYFDIDTVQVYSLPILLVQQGDSTRYKAEADTIYLKQLVLEIPDSVAVEAMPLRENTDLIRMNQAVNYPYILIGVGIFILILTIVLVVFGKKLLTFYRLHRLNKKHIKFLESFDALADQTSLSVQEKAEELIVLWKKYLQQLESFPYTTLTTLEVIERIPKEGLTSVLHELDASLYSPRHPPMERKRYEILKEYANERYERQIIKLKNRE